MEDLSVVPRPNRDLYYRTYPFIGAFSWKKFMSGRGCIPGETYEDACSTLRLNEEIGADYIRMGFATPIPNTTMATTAIADGLLDAARAADSGEPAGPFALRRPVFGVAEPERLTKLYYLSKLYSVVKVSPLIPHLDKIPLSRLLTVLELMSPYNEKQIFHLGILNGLRYFRHTGAPHKRTTNYVSII